MSGPFKLKGWSPFTKKSALKNKGDADHQNAWGEGHTHPPGKPYKEPSKEFKNNEAITDQEIKIEGANSDLDDGKITKEQHNKVVSGAKNKIASLKKKP
jgi:hypothetical protein